MEIDKLKKDVDRLKTELTQKDDVIQNIQNNYNELSQAYSIEIPISML